MGNNSYRTIQIRKELHNKIRRLAILNDLKMKIVGSEIIARMLTEHDKEVEEIIKELRILK